MDERNKFLRYAGVRNLVRESLADGAVANYRSIATSLRGERVYLKREEVEFVAQALGVRVRLSVAGRPKEHNFAGGGNF
jgi:hypothetical protein